MTRHSYVQPAYTKSAKRRGRFTYRVLTYFFSQEGYLKRDMPPNKERDAQRQSSQVLRGYVAAALRILYP